MRPPQLRCELFPSMYLPHLLVLPATFGLQCLLPPYPYFRALYAVPVRQVRGLLTASFRFRLTADTLAVQLCASSLPTRTQDFHPLETAHAGQTKSLQTRKRVRREVEFSSGRVYTAHQSTVFLFGGLCCQIFMKLFLLKQEIIRPIARDFRPFHKKPRFCKIYIV